MQSRDGCLAPPQLSLVQDYTAPILVGQQFKFTGCSRPEPGTPVNVRREMRDSHRISQPSESLASCAVVVVVLYPPVLILLAMRLCQCPVVSPTLGHQRRNAWEPARNISVVEIGGTSNLEKSGVNIFSITLVVARFVSWVVIKLFLHQT